MPAKKPKILFCTPPEPERSGAHEAFSQGGSSFPSIGLLILAEIARKEGHEVCFRDFLNKHTCIDGAVSQMLALGVDVVSISSNTDSIFTAAKFAEEIKNRSGVTVFIGGPHVSAVPEETMRKCPAFDIGFIGESEETFREVLSSDMSLSSLAKIKGIMIRDGSGVISAGRRPFIEQLDDIPFPAWDLIEDFSIYKPAVTNYKKEPVFSLMTSRGCFGRCIFCDRGVFGNKVRMHSAGYVMSMIRKLRGSFGINEITFYDDNLVVDKTRLKEICERIKTEEKGLSWSCSARVDFVNEETLSMMKDAGCWQISFGVESGSQKILDSIQKGIKVEMVHKTAAVMKKLGLSMRGYFIIGNPGETVETLEETLKLILSVPMDDILVEYMTPYPGTEIYENISKYGVTKGGWSDLNSYDMNFVPHGMDERTLREYFAKYYKMFYLRPGVVLNYAKRLKSPAKMIGLGIKYLKFQSANRNV